MNCVGALQSDDNEVPESHRNVTRQKSYNCNLCSDTFSNRFNLEDHTVTVHAIKKEFKCQICSHAFLKEWRYNMLMIIHQKSESIRKYHYFNNGLECPYMKTGCKFLHELCDVCKFGPSCKMTMCQFRH